MSHRPSAARRQGVAASVGLIVEGDAEFAAIPLLYRQGLVGGCPPLKVLNLGGVGAERKPEGIARLVTPKVVQLQVKGCARVIICIDREHRAQCAPGLASAVLGALRTELTRRSRQHEGVHVVVVDRAFEAWLLADARGLHARGALKRAPKFGCFEGQLGERNLKGCVELEALLGRSYSKTRDGPTLFAKLDFAAARRHVPGGTGSKSLDKFLRTLGV